MGSASKMLVASEIRVYACCEREQAYTLKCLMVRRISAEC